MYARMVGDDHTTASRNMAVAAIVESAVTALDSDVELASAVRAVVAADQAADALWLSAAVVAEACADCGGPFGYDVPAGTICSSCDSTGAEVTS
jgi:hypothetical protein